MQEKIAEQEMTNDGDITVVENNGIKQHAPASFKNCDISGSTLKSFRHAELVYVSGKEGAFEGFDFSYAVMTDCYFHNATFMNCKFTGSRMYRCNFRGAKFINCDFRYIDMDETRISTEQMLGNMPDFPNIAREIAQVMRRNATSLGDVASSRKFMIFELEQRQEHIRRALRGQGDYYKEKYDTWRKRLRLRWHGLMLKADKFLWGHGEKVWRIFLSIGSLLLFLSIISSAMWVYENPDSSAKAVWETFLATLKYFTSFFLAVDVETTIERSWTIELVLAASRLLFVGVLISALFRWLSHR